MDVFEFTDDSDDDVGFLSGVSRFKTSSRQERQQLKELHDSTKSLLDSIKKDSKNPSSSKKEQIRSISTNEEQEKLHEDSALSPAVSTPTFETQSEITVPSPSDSTVTTPSSTTPKPKSTSKSVASRLPLMLPASQPRATTLLVQLEDAKLDLSGDVGAIGRFHLHQQDQILLDLKGQQYVGEIVPCGSFMVVGIGANEAKVETIVNDFCQISKQTNVLEQIGGIVTAGNLQQQEEDSDEQGSKQKQKQKSDAAAHPKSAIGTASTRKAAGKKQTTPRQKKTLASTASSATKAPRKKLKSA